MTYPGASRVVFYTYGTAGGVLDRELRATHILPGECRSRQEIALLSSLARERGRDSFFAAETRLAHDENLFPPRKKNPDPVGIAFRCGVELLNRMVKLLYGVHLTDEAT